MREMTRREFVIKSVGSGVALSALSFGDRLLAREWPDMVVTRNGSPAELVRKAVEELGGMSRFVKKGQTVLVKPNIGWDRLPEQAANTNPEVVAEVVKMCKEAGAKRVRVLDRTCNQARRCYKRSGIEAAAKKAGAEVRHVVKSRFKKVEIPNGELVKAWPFYKDALEADVFINIPIAKSHSISRVTLGFKNIMGVIGGDRGAIHKNFHTKIVDLNLALQPDLTIIDAYRILLRNGPSGGNLADVAEKRIIIAGTDPVAVDAYAIRLFQMDPSEIEYLSIAEKRGLGKMQLGEGQWKEIDLAV